MTLSLTFPGRDSESNVSADGRPKYNFLLVFNGIIYPNSTVLRFKGLKSVTRNLTFQRPFLKYRLIVELKFSCMNHYQCSTAVCASKLDLLLSEIQNLKI